MYELKSNQVGTLIHADKVESSALDQIKLIANHPSIRGLVSIMPDVHAGAGCVIGFTGKFGESVIPNIVGVDIGCFLGSTKIPLYNRGQHSLKSLVGQKPFFVYSLNENLEMVAGEAIAVKTKSDAELIELTIEGVDEGLICTPDQEFMILDGSYIKAEDLEYSDTLMSTLHLTPGRHGEHKVVSTRRLDYREDVYCLQVKEYHNFALSAGPFVHNCGVISHSLLLKNLDLPAIYDYIETNIPSGFNSHKHRVAVNKDENKVLIDCEELVSSLKLKANPSLQAGTLGGGNHFIEIEESETTGNRYLTIHSGSRKFGLEVAKYYQKKAKELMKSMNISVPNDLEYLPLGKGQLGDDYMRDMRLAQRYADVNRKLMMKTILEFIGLSYDEKYVTSSIHNYISDRDNIIRKGAISAHCHEPVVIPLNMGKDGGIILGTGLGNKNYNYSAPHGAGRVAGRNVMKRKLKSGEITMHQFNDTMRGIYSKSVVESTIDESAMAYKPFETIKEHLEETIVITDIARPIMSFKDVK